MIRKFGNRALLRGAYLPTARVRLSLLTFFVQRDEGFAKHASRSSSRKPMQRFPAKKVSGRRLFDKCAPGKTIKHNKTPIK
jgi:hypothetical protein